MKKILQFVMLPPKILEGDSFLTCHSAAKFHPNRSVWEKVYIEMSSNIGEKTMLLTDNNTM